MRATFRTIGELFITFAVLVALFMGWMIAYTGIQASIQQYKSETSTNWSEPTKDDGKYKIAKPQKGDPPVDTKDYPAGTVLGQLYVPRFGQNWNRVIYQDTSLTQLDKGGEAHYMQTPLFGAIGNVGIAGHRNGYGDPLSNIDTFKSGDAVVVRTKDYWYVYTYTSHEIVEPTDGGVLDPVPNKPTEKPAKRLMTLTTCTPKYATITQRWIAYTQYKYWAKVSDGIPAELASNSANSGSVFSAKSAKLPFWASINLKAIAIGLLTLYVLLYIIFAVKYRWQMKHPYHYQGIYTTLYDLQPAGKGIRILLEVILLAGIALSLFEWGFPAIQSIAGVGQVTVNA